MEEEMLVIRALLALVVAGCLAYFAVEYRDMQQGQRPKPPSGRDLTREHHLGGHKETAAWGCPLCDRFQAIVPREDTVTF